ncbi:MAG TPA: Rho termination factor N-terminal domain-containing protein, partial [Gemmataceae bacterium]|nr:Rho termination factor N-terminal domain-containing protein [Gemmataceae bacterium]
MAEAKSRRESPGTRMRPRSKSDFASSNGEEESPATEAGAPQDGFAEPAAPPRPESPRGGEDFGGFDEEINNRYEEIKRGSTHISELQQMTMPQLLKVAKDEGLSDYTGLKKQDLIFKILKERVKQNGLMFGEGTLEVLP